MSIVMPQPAVIDIGDIVGRGSSDRKPTFCLSTNPIAGAAQSATIPKKCALIGFYTNTAATIISKDGRTTVPGGQFAGQGGGLVAAFSSNNTVFGLYFPFDEGEKIWVAPAGATVSLYFEERT